MKRMRAEWQPMLVVADAMESIGVRPVFVGGHVAALLITDPAAPPPRPTDDVDVIVEIATIVQYHALGARLRAIGFEEDVLGGVMCRWTFRQITVDVMPADGSVMGLSSKWFAESFESARQVELAGGKQLWVVTGPYFVALKLEAFADRGDDDHAASHDIEDIEDIVTLIDGRDELVCEIEAAPSELRDYLAQRVGELLDRRAFTDALSGHLAGDEVSQARLPIVEQRLRRIASRP